MNRSLIAVALLALAALPGCGKGAGSGLPCASDNQCAIGEACVQTSCEASGPTCEHLCEVDSDCTGGLDTSPSGAVCLPADLSLCPREGQELVTSYCAR